MYHNIFSKNATSICFFALIFICYIFALNFVCFIHTLENGILVFALRKYVSPIIAEAFNYNSDDMNINAQMQLHNDCNT